MRNTGVFLISVLVLGLFFLFGCNEIGNSVEEQSDRAVTLNKPSLCNDMEDTSQQIDCMARTADIKSDPKICAQSTASPVDCVVTYAQRRNDISACNVLSDPVKKYTCVAKFTGDSTGRAIDTIIGDYNTKGKVSACHNQCITDMNTCRGKCEDTMTVKVGDCYGLEYHQRENCSTNAINEKYLCQARCKDVEMGACDAKCKEITS